MKTKTIRISGYAHRTLREMAAAAGQSPRHVLEAAIEERRRRLYLEGLNADYEKLTRDPKAAAEPREEMEAWNTTNSEGRAES